MSAKNKQGVTMHVLQGLGVLTYYLLWFHPMAIQSLKKWSTCRVLMLLNSVKK